MKNVVNIAVVGLGQVGIYLLNELNIKKKDIELKTGKNINIVELNDNAFNKTNVKNFNSSDTEFKSMSFNEFELFLEEYSKNSNYPDINK